MAVQVFGTDLHDTLSREGIAEEYGTRTAFDEAADVLEENVLEDKERKQLVRKGDKARRRTEKLVDWWREAE